MMAWLYHSALGWPSSTTLPWAAQSSFGHYTALEMSGEPEEGPGKNGCFFETSEGNNSKLLTWVASLCGCHKHCSCIKSVSASPHHSPRPLRVSELLAMGKTHCSWEGKGRKESMGNITIKRNKYKNTPTMYSSLSQGLPRSVYSL